MTLRPRPPASAPESGLRAGPFLVRAVSYPPAERMATHEHAHPSVTLVLAGGIRERVGSREEAAGPLSVVVKPAGVAHADEFGPAGARTLQVVAPAPGIGDAWRGGWRWHHARGGLEEFLALARCAARSGTDPAALECRVWELLGALPGSHEETGPAPPPWILRVRERIDDTAGGSVQVRDLAGEAGVHPVSLTRAFRRHFGESVTAYRRRARLRRAAASLVSDQGTTLSRIAHRSGFSDHPHLSREFRSATGMTPSDYRRVARAYARSPGRTSRA